MKADEEVKQLLKAGTKLLIAGAKLLVAKADQINHNTTGNGGHLSEVPPTPADGFENEPQPDVVSEGKSETTESSTGVSEQKPSASVSQDQSSSNTEAPSPPPPSTESGNATPPPPPPPNSDKAAKPGRKITQSRAQKLNVAMVEVAQNLGDDKPVRELLLEFGVTSPAEFDKVKADAFVAKLKEL